MSLLILDTDHVSLWQNNNFMIRCRLALLDPKNFAVTIVTFEEQMRGRLNAIQQAGSEEALVLAYHNLKKTDWFFHDLNVLEFTSEAYAVYSDLKRQRVRIGARDLRISAIALSVNGIVVTRNQRDFRQVPALRLEDWTVEN